MEWGVKGWKVVAAWSERVGAVVLALVALGVIVQGLGSGERVASAWQAWRAEDWWKLALSVVVTAAAVTAIIVGQRRSRVLRIAGWFVLLAYAALT